MKLVFNLQYLFLMATMLKYKNNPELDDASWQKIRMEYGPLAPAEVDKLYRSTVPTARRVLAGIKKL